MSTPPPGAPLQSATRLLQQYQVIERISGRMLTEAQAKHWDKVIELGQAYNTEVARLQEFPELSTDDRNARRDILIRILDNDACIRHLVTPELERLSHLLGTLKRQQAVLQTYSAPVFNP
ncbi:MAG: flagellar protein FliT [Burkholderiaceae bacterium]